jgi:hypothetical protein
MLPGIAGVLEGSFDAMVGNFVDLELQEKNAPENTAVSMAYRRD